MHATTQTTDRVDQPNSHTEYKIAKNEVVVPQQGHPRSNILGFKLSYDYYSPRSNILDFKLSYDHYSPCRTRELATRGWLSRKKFDFGYIVLGLESWAQFPRMINFTQLSKLLVRYIWIKYTTWENKEKSNEFIIHDIAVLAQRRNSCSDLVLISDSHFMSWPLYISAAYSLLNPRTFPSS